MPAFTSKQKEVAHTLLATQVVFMMGRKLEEADWSSVYCMAKGIPERGWSNLSIDVMYRGLGVEHKTLRVSSDAPIRTLCGTSLMHPSATRSIRIASTDADPNQVMADVLTQYARNLDERRARIQEDCPDEEPDLRTGWLLWQTSLIEFLYFEEEALSPDPADYFAEWKESGGTGARKPSKNLWIYEKEGGRKRYSVTTAAGAKIQPYFDVPPPNDPNLYVFRVQGEEIASGVIRVWVGASTARELEQLVGSLTPEKLMEVIASVASEAEEGGASAPTAREQAIPIMLTAESYRLLVAAFPGAVSDEHLAQLLLGRLRE
ncbi:MAG: hypothetical protein KGL59_08735 [Acidobacteriota bacterium]|nr:hypothetical protein [Acidobacteriota bacterium]